MAYRLICNPAPCLPGARYLHAVGERWDKETSSWNVVRWELGSVGELEETKRTRAANQTDAFKSRGRDSSFCLYSVFNVAGLILLSFFSSTSPSSHPLQASANKKPRRVVFREVGFPDGGRLIRPAYD